MAGPIVLSSLEGATNSDILQGTRLQTVPQGGYLTFELQTTVNDATNFMNISIQFDVVPIRFRFISIDSNLLIYISKHVVLLFLPLKGDLVTVSVSWFSLFPQTYSVGVEV